MGTGTARENESVKDLWRRIVRPQMPEPSCEMEIPEPELLRRHAAYHAAGHVIADLLFGFRFRFVTIRADESGGDDGAICGNTRGRARDLAVVQLAGVAASAKMRGLDSWEKPDAFDDNNADRAAARNFIDNWAGFLFRTYGESSLKTQLQNEIEKKTRLLVDQNWKPIAIIADALLERETLSYDDVIRVLRDQCPDFIIGQKP
jgi:hypothetical protein